MKQNPFVEKWKKELKMRYEYMSSYQKPLAEDIKVLLALTEILADLYERIEATQKQIILTRVAKQVGEDNEELIKQHAREMYFTVYYRSEEVENDLRKFVKKLK